MKSNLAKAATLLVILLIFSQCQSSAYAQTLGTIPASAHQGKLHIFLLPGQSNMVGVDTPPSNQLVPGTVYNFGNDYRWHVGIEPIDDSTNVVDPVSADTFSGFGPGVAFATRLQELRGSDYIIGLVPCAKGGSYIGDWQRSLSDNTLYGSCLKRARAASVMGSIDGILFYQGENEAEFCLPWKPGFEAFVSSVRQDYGYIPIVFVQINNLLPASLFPCTAQVQQEQASVNMLNVYMVSAVGLPTLADGIHLTSAGETTLGRMMAEGSSWDTMLHLVR